METTLISKCCGEEAIKRFGGDEISYQCIGCDNQCEVGEVCAECLGTGEVMVLEKVYPGEPHTAPMARPCPSCKKAKNHEL